MSSELRWHLAGKLMNKSPNQRTNKQNCELGTISLPSLQLIPTIIVNERAEIERTIIKKICGTDRDDSLSASSVRH